jgi:hypothetical protein
MFQTSIGPSGLSPGWDNNIIIYSTLTLHSI